MSTHLTLPIWATVKTAYQDVFGNIGQFISVAWLVFMMMVLFVEIPTIIVSETIYQAMHPEAGMAEQKSEGDAALLEKKAGLPVAESTQAEKEIDAARLQKKMMQQGENVKIEHLALLMLLNLFQMALIFSFSVAWYRQLLFAENRGKTIIFKFGKDEWQFAVTAMKTGFALAPVVLVMMSFVLASIPGFAEGKPESLLDNWPLFVSGNILMLYLTARLSMSYPLTVMGKTEAPIKQSWLMTVQAVWRIMAGNILIALPTFLISVVVVIGLSYLFNTPTPSGVEDVMADETRLPFVQHVLFKSIGAAFLLIVFALISAFYARVYAFLVRSQADGVKD